MNYSFTWGFVGLLIMVAGGLMIVYHKWISDSFLGGLGSYQKVKIWGMIVIGVGFLLLTNLHLFLLRLFLHLIMPSRF